MLERTVQQLFAGEDVRYRVPIYQRHYVWNETHWEHLWDDIEEKTNSILADTRLVQPVPHFTGVIVTRENEEKEKVIVDGQQRLTTFQIIFCAIRDICKTTFPGTSDPMEILKSVNRLLQNPPHPIHEDAPDRLYKLLPTEGPDRKAFRALVAGTPHSNGLLPKAYSHFKDKIEQYVVNDYQKMVALSQTLFFYFKIVEMPLERSYQPAKVFESLNGRGLPLTQFDLLRNNVFLRAGDKKNSLYESCWSHFNTEPYWLSDKIVDDFLKNFLEAKLKISIDPKRGTLFDLYQRKYISNLRGKLGIEIGYEDNQQLVECEFKELQRYSKTYAEISNSSVESPIWFYHFLKTRLQIESWHPLILLLKTELDLSEEDEKKILHILESYIVRHILCYRETPEWLRETQFRELRNEIVKEISKQIPSEDISSTIIGVILNSLGKAKTEWPSNEQVSEALKTAGHHEPKLLIRYILFKIESQNTDPQFIDTQLRDFSVFDTEHVMPRSWKNAINPDTDEKSWPIIGGGKEYEAKEHARTIYVHSIGNLTITNQQFNRQKLGNKSFDEKKALYSKHSRLSLTVDIVSYSEWDVEEIQEREEKLVRLFCEIWPIYRVN